MRYNGSQRIKNWSYFLLYISNYEGWTILMKTDWQSHIGGQKAYKFIIALQPGNNPYLKIWDNDFLLGFFQFN